MTTPTWQNSPIKHRLFLTGFFASFAISVISVYNIYESVSWTLDKRSDVIGFMESVKMLHEQLLVEPDKTGEMVADKEEIESANKCIENFKRVRPWQMGLCDDWLKTKEMSLYDLEFRFQHIAGWFLISLLPLYVYLGRTWAVWLLTGEKNFKLFNSRA